MDKLYNFHDNVIRHVPDSFSRFLFKEINWDQRMLAIRGPRGAGKTTLMLQRIRNYPSENASKSLYVTADHPWFYTNTLFDTAGDFYIHGGRFLFIDEVHKYPNWSTELKNIYDGYREMKIVFTSSSALDLFRGEADLSRRLTTYELPGLSFREYLSLTGIGQFDKQSFHTILNHHKEITKDIVSLIQPLPIFKTYLKSGYLPYFTENTEQEYLIRTGQVINTIIESDLAYIQGYTPATANKVKKLAGLLAESVPFKPNISALARKLDVGRDSVYSWLIQLEKARLFNLLTSNKKGSAMLQKPEKVYLENTNLAYALTTTPEKGNLRETFLLNQMINSKLDIHVPVKGDFLHDDIMIEVGGKNKTSQQVRHHQNHIVIADDIETGFGKKIPLWLFGFMY
jgi:uncharacterized protein